MVTIVLITTNSINNFKQASIMSKEEILSVIRTLAMSQGFYGRLLEAIEENEEILDDLVAQNFGDVVDLVMYIEG
jgi:hypothetical protein